MPPEAAEATVRAPWLPLTPRGAARFARRGGVRFWLVVLLGAMAIGLACGRLAFVGWFPAIDEAVLRLPERAALDGGVLRWPGQERSVLVENTWLGIAVDPAARGPGGQEADVQADFTRDALWLTVLTGYLRLPYPAGYVLRLDRGAVTTRWEAWRPHLLVAVGVGVATLMVLGWAVLAIPLGLAEALLAWLLGGGLRLASAWRLAIASFFPGAILVATALFLYSFRFVNVAAAAGIGLFHAVWTLGILLLGPWFLGAPVVTEAREQTAPPSAGNPFRPAADVVEGDSRNPFAARREAGEEPPD
ncbi:MAG: hypothetical protein H7A47_15580 [Verrucomicrobiales bacterium]|nr:hypothetical protein [Verrucomicrobiales bacterium]